MQYKYDRVFVITAFGLQLALLVYFILRKSNFDYAIRWGWVVYALAIPAALVSVVMLRAGKPISFWLGGFLFAAWGLFGYLVDIARPVAWRSPPYFPVFISYVLLYLSAQMFYWFPVGKLQRGLWYLYALLFVASTYFNFTSHQ